MLRQIPNALSVARLLLGLAFPWIPPDRWLAAIALALLTEFADGVIAREFDCETPLGKLLDPIADKVFVTMVLGTLIWHGSLLWWEAVLLLGRDLVVVGAALHYGLSRRTGAVMKMEPSWPGKIATTVQFAVLLVAGAGWRLEWLVDATALVSVYAGMDYIVRYDWRPV